MPEKKFYQKLRPTKKDIKLNEKISIPYECENRHIFTIGKPGSGKTQLICKALERIIDRNEKAIIYDFKGDYISRFYNPATDLIFNPLDNRSVGWCLFNEIQSMTNVEAICNSLIPISTNKEPFWENAARDVLFSCILYCMKNNLLSNQDIYNVSIKSRDDLLQLFRATPGCERGLRPLEEAKVGASVLSTFSQYVKFMEYTKSTRGNFSIKEWITDESQKGRIFITNYTEIGHAMQPLLSLFIDICANRILMLPQDLNRRIFLILDEFGTLQKLNNILNMLKLSRSFGGSIWIGIQDIGQIESIYGRESTKTIINSCANSIIFGVDEPITAEELSKKMGDQERSNMDSNIAFGTNQHKDGQSMSERTKLERLVLPSDIMRLSDLHFYFKVAKFAEFTISRLCYQDFPLKHEPLIDVQCFIQNEEVKI